MSAEYSVARIRKAAKETFTLEQERMLTAYAERIEADERAVPVAWQQKRRPEDYPDEWRECSKETFVFVNQRKESPWIVRELFDNPPAQAAQWDEVDVELACKAAAMHADGAVFPDAYGDDEVEETRETMRAALRAVWGRASVAAQQPTQRAEGE